MSDDAEMLYQAAAYWWWSYPQVVESVNVPQDLVTVVREEDNAAN